MKTSQDWSFITRKSDMVQPKLQENKIFHALTAAYQSNQQGEFYGATEAIVKREKELCEMALLELKKLQGTKEERDETLALIIDHYQQRLDVSREKEGNINRLSEDTRKMMEEHRSKNQELAEVKRNLMESQSKLRTLAKETEKLIKKEEELRFIEENLRTEIDKNKRHILNGLYEIVAELPDNAALAATEPAAAVADFSSTNKPASPKAAPNPISKTEAETRRDSLGPSPEFKTGEMPILTRKPTETVFFRNPEYQEEESENMDAETWDPTQLLTIALDLQGNAPSREQCARSFAKTPAGEVIAEYLYLPGVPKERRHYIFNALSSLISLLELNAKDKDQFQERLELVFGDLLSRLQKMKSIHIEDCMTEYFSQAPVLELLSASPKDQNTRFLEIAARALGTLEEIGAQRKTLIQKQLENQIGA